MILQALANYYQRMLDDPACDVAQPGFEKKAIPFLIVLDRQGRFVNIRDTRTGEGKKKLSREFVVPQGVKRTGNKPNPNLLWDHAGYVLGYNPKDPELAAKQQSAFLDRIREVFGNNGYDPGLEAVFSFYANRESERVISAENFRIIDENGGNITFILAEETLLICQSEYVVRKVTESFGKDDGLKRVCLVTGDIGSITRLHPVITGVWKTDKGRGNIVAFKPPSFDSFGKKQGFNAPVSHNASFAYTTALNTLLAKGSRQRIQVGDASTVFWAQEQHEFEEDFSLFLGEPAKGREPDYSRLRSLLSAVRTGVLPDEDSMPFYVLGLAPNASRIAIRFWYEGSIEDMKQKISQHFEDIDIVRAPHDREFLSLFQLLVATATEGKADNIPPNLGGEIARAVFNGSTYPRTLLAGAIRRCKAEQRVPYARAAIIKGFLCRQARLHRTENKEVGVMLDTANDNIGYVLGRLFAVLERIQETAHTGLNKTIRDTYFSAATSNPLVIFKRLHELAVHHLAKIRNSGKSTVWLDKLMGEIMGKIPASGIPVTLSLEDQGRFAVGYYHQRQDFFNSDKGESKGE